MTSVRPLVVPLVRVFSWNWIFFFSKFWQHARNLYKVVCDRTEFFGKKNFLEKFFFAYRCKFVEINSLEINSLDIVKTGCSRFDHGPLKLTVSQELTDRINWFFAFCYKFRKGKSCLNGFWVDRGLKFHEI